MSFDIHLQSPIQDQPEDDRALAAEAAQGILAPFLDASGAAITTPDGGAAIYGCEDLGNGFMVNHASGDAIWDLLVEVARATEFVILPVGCGTCIPFEGMRAVVADDLPEPVVVVSTGADLLEVILSA